MTHEDERIDLSALDPEADPDRLERVTAGVLDRLGPGIVDEPALLRHEVARIVAARFHALLGTASLVATVAAILLVRSVTASDPGPQTPAATVVGVPDDLAAWLFTGSAPSAENLLFLTAGGDR